VLALHAVTRAWLGGTRALEPSLVLVLFFLAGGFGFVFFFQRLFGGEALWPMLQSVNATYDISPHIAKGGHIGNLFLASRCASYGMSIGLCALLLLGQALAQPGRRAPLLVAGIALGALPLVHTHSFLVCGGLMLWQFWTAQPRPAVTRAAFCLVPFALVAVPEWLFLSHGGRVSFLRFEPGFLRPAPSGLDWFLDVVLGMGLGWLLLPWAWRNASPRSRRLLWPLLALLPLANLVAFAPSAYDNVKLIAWFDLGLAILLAGWLARKLSAAPAARIGALVAIAGCTLSGALAVGFELANDALAVPTADVALARLVTAHAPPNAVIATAATEHDPVVMLAGRRALMATPHMARLNGLPVAARATEIFRLYAGGPAASELIEAYDVFAVLIGPDERADLPRVDEAFFARHSRAVYETAGRRLYVLDRQPSR